MNSLLSLVLGVSLSLGVLVPPSPTPVSSIAPSAPTLTAKAWILYDATAGVVLDGVAIDEPRAMASVTKIMTALVVKDHAEMDERTRISFAAADVGESEVGLVPGERWSVEDLLYGIMVRSGNDAAYALAEHVAGDVPSFVAMMNEKAASMGLQNTSFANPHGLDAEGHYSSPRDLALMGTEYLQNDALARMAKTRRVAFKQAPNGTSRIVGNTNHLLGVFPGVSGIKTGYTGRAGLVLVSSLELPERTLIGVVMGSDAHFDDSRDLLDYGARLITFRDRVDRLALPESGGGDLMAVAGADLDEATRNRLSAVLPLPTGRDRVTTFSDTTMGRLIDSRLRSLLPVVLGGTD